MRNLWIPPVVGMFCLMGCATTGGGQRAVATMARSEGLRASETRVVDAHVNPYARVTETGVSRVVLRDGRFVVCWRGGSATADDRLVAQAWTAGGSPLGPPVTVSPSDARVLGPPKLIAIDSDHAVATFSALSGDRFERLAVTLEVL